MPQPRPASSNGLGIAGFVVSLVGLVTCFWIICPIGLALSFFAMFRRPRGMAIAGFILGLLGSLWIIVVVIFLAIMGIGVAAMGTLGFGLIEVTSDTMKINQGIEAHYRANSALPSTLTLLALDTDTLTDPWGEAYRYEIDPDGRRYTISTAGPDGVWDTDDDVSLDQDVLGP